MNYSDVELRRQLEVKQRIAEVERALAVGELPQDPDAPPPDFTAQAKFWGSEMICHTVRYGLPVPQYLPVLGKPGFLRRGYSHILAAAPKMGKTELLLQSIGDWTDDVIAYFTEEYPDVWQERLSVAAKTFPGRYYAHTQFISLPRIPHEARPSTIEAILRDPYFTIVLVDTIRAGLELEDENDNSALRRNLEPLTATAHAYEKTLILVHHTNKAQAHSGSQLSLAGGMDLQGAMDAVLVLAPVHRRQNLNEDTRRVLHGWGRMRCGGTLYYEWPDRAGPLRTYDPGSFDEDTLPAQLGDAWVTTAQTGATVAQLKAWVLQGLVECDMDIDDIGRGARPRWRRATLEF